MGVKLKIKDRRDTDDERAVKPILWFGKRNR